jgi:2-oxoisovalerate dehydrogenase E2 component (dihydrolipoyl transacylase)
MSAEDVKPFLVPDLGEGLEEATVACWNVKVGDDVELNQTLCSLETAKAEVEIPSPYAGRIVELRGAEGDVLEVGSVLVRIDTGPDPAVTAPAPHGEAQNGSGPDSAESNGSHGARTAVLVGYGADDGIDTSRRSGRGPSSDAPGARPRAAPPVRKLAAELLVDLADLQPGSGRGGVITREDVLAAAGPARGDVVDPKPGRGYDVIPVRRVQARMAERMTLSRSAIPDSHASVQVDCTSLLDLRDRFRGAAGENGKHVTPFVLALRLLIVALTHNKVFNSTWVESASGPQVHAHRSVHLGFGVATQRGLLVPVVTDAQDRTTLELAARVAELIRGAREGSLKPTELQGSTFTVSNFGALGLDEGVPVINYPEAAILGMGSLKPRAVVVDDNVVIRPMMTLTCAFDHRIADGAQVANFLGETRELIESPEMALLHL